MASPISDLYRLLMRVTENISDLSKRTGKLEGQVTILRVFIGTQLAATLVNTVPPVEGDLVVIGDANYVVVNRRLQVTGPSPAWEVQVELVT
jgi:hypothetical protein